MLIVTTNGVSEYEIVETLGQVFGLVVRSRGGAGDLAAGLRSLVGGEITEYSQMLEDARRHALDRLAENAQLMGADAVVGMRFDSSEIGETMTEVVAYGTAVRFARHAAHEAGGSPAMATATATATASAPSTFGHRIRGL